MKVFKEKNKQTAISTIFNIADILWSLFLSRVGEAVLRRWLCLRTALRFCRRDLAGQRQGSHARGQCWHRTAPGCAAAVARLPTSCEHTSGTLNPAPRGGMAEGTLPAGPHGAWWHFGGVWLMGAEVFLLETAPQGCHEHGSNPFPVSMFRISSTYGITTLPVGCVIALCASPEPLAR